MSLEILGFEEGCAEFVSTAVPGEGRVAGNLVTIVALYQIPWDPVDLHLSM